MKPKRLDIIIRTRSDGKYHAVSSICGNVAMTAKCNSAEGRVEFDMMDVPKVNCRFGDACVLSLDGELIFQGKLFSITRDNSLYKRHYVFCDESYYLRNSISYPVPKSVPMVKLVKSLLDKYEIGYSRIDYTNEVINERKISNISVLEAINNIVSYVLYMYDKMYVLRQNKGRVEFVDIEAANVAGFKNSYPLVIEFSNEETIAKQTYNYFEFYKKDKTKKKSGTGSTSDKKGNKTSWVEKPEGFSQSDLNPDIAKTKLATKGYVPAVGKSVRKSGKKTVKYYKPLVPYELQKINMEIAMYAIGGVNSATAKKELAGKPEMIKDIDAKPKGYALGSKGYKLTGEVKLWGYLPFIKEVPEIPPEQVIEQMINVRRNPVRSAKFTVLVHEDFYLPGDKLFIGESPDLASVYVIDAVTTRFLEEEVIQELDIFSWQKTYDIQKLILAESVKKIEKNGGIEAVQSFAAKNNVDLIYKKSEGTNDAGFVVTDKVFADYKKNHPEDRDPYWDYMDGKLSELDKLGEKINDGGDGSDYFSKMDKIIENMTGGDK